MSLLPRYLPQIHKIDQVSQLSYHDHQRAPHNHNHSLPLLQPRKSETLTQLDSRALPPGASHSLPELDSCYHQTEHVSTDLWAWFQLSADHHTLNRGNKKRTKKLIQSKLAFSFHRCPALLRLSAFLCRSVKQDTEWRTTQVSIQIHQSGFFLYKFWFVTRDLSIFHNFQVNDKKTQVTPKL